MTEVHESPELHAALHSLTAGPPPDLANLVIAGAIRRRARNRMIIVLATVVTLLAISLPIAVLQHRAPPPGRPPSPTATLPVPSLGPPVEATGFAHPPHPGGGPRVLDAFVISPNPNTGRSMLLDRASGRYVELPFSGIVLSPDGTMLAVLSRGNDFTDPHVQVGVVSRADALARHLDRVRWLTLGTDPVWSPDGSKLLVDTNRHDQPLPSPLPSNATVLDRLSVFEAGSWGRADLQVRLAAYGFGHLAWSADSSQLVCPVLAPESTPEHPVLGAMQYVRLDGSLGRRVGSHGGEIFQADAYSPSGRRVIAFDAGQVVVMDSRDWHVIFGRPAPDSQFVGWYDEDHVLALTENDGTGENPVLQVLDMSGHVTKQVAMPGNTNMRMQFRSSAGLTGEAATLGF